MQVLMIADISRRAFEYRRVRKDESFLHGALLNPCSRNASEREDCSRTGR